jgi:hypothetical protein
MKDVKGSADIARIIGRDMLKFDDFELEIFVEQFESGRVILLMDGVDEIAPTFTELFVKLMKSIQKLSNNQLWIATRTHMQETLLNSLNFSIFKLLELDEPKIREFFTTVYKDLSIEGRVKTNESELIEKSIRLLKSFEAQRNELQMKMKESLIGSPMILGMIAQLFKEDPNFVLKRPNMYSIYDKFTTLMMLKLHDKGDIAREDMVKNMKSEKTMKFHQKIAIAVYFSKPLSMSDLSVLLPHEMARIGLAYNDSGRVYFVHRTFSEFFVAQYYVDTIFGNSKIEKKDFDDAMKYVLSKERTTKFLVYSFMDSALDMQIISEKYQAIESYFTENEVEVQNAIYALASNGYINLVNQ